MLRFFFWYVTFDKYVLTWIGHMQKPNTLDILKDLAPFYSLPALCPM